MICSSLNCSTPSVPSESMVIAFPSQRTGPDPAGSDRPSPAVRITFFCKLSRRTRPSQTLCLEVARTSLSRSGPAVRAAGRACPPRRASPCWRPPALGRRKGPTRRDWLRAAGRAWPQTAARRVRGPAGPRPTREVGPSKRGAAAAGGGRPRRSAGANAGRAASDRVTIRSGTA